MRQVLEQWNRGDVEGLLESWNLEAEEFREFGDQVLVLTRVRAKGRGSGLEFDQSLAHLFEFRGHLICRAETFLDRDKAVDVAASLQERA